MTSGNDGALPEFLHEKIKSIGTKIKKYCFIIYAAPSEQLIDRIWKKVNDFLKKSHSETHQAYKLIYLTFETNKSWYINIPTGFLLNSEF